MRAHPVLLTAVVLGLLWAVPAAADWSDDDDTSDDDGGDDDVSACTVESYEESGRDCFECMAPSNDDTWCEEQHGDSGYQQVCSREEGVHRFEVWCEDTGAEPPGCAHGLTPRVPSMAIPVLISGLLTLTFLAWRRDD